MYLLTDSVRQRLTHICQAFVLARGSLLHTFTLLLCGMWAFPVSSGTVFTWERFTVSRKHVNWALSFSE